MTAVIAYKSDQKRGHAWREYFGRSDSGVEFRVWPDIGDPAEVRYLAVWDPLDNLVDEFPNLEVLFSTGAGVDQFDLSAIPERIKIVRLIDPAIIEGMREYVSFAVLALHRNILDYRNLQAAKRWQPLDGRSAADVCVGVMGLGSLGRAVLDALHPFGFQLRAWSRSAHDLDGVQCFAGTTELREFASACNILVCLLPLTVQTRGILGRDLFAAMPRGAALVNAGRGDHLHEDDLVEALDGGQLSGAILDVMADEPPPGDHLFWEHPRILLTPHVASMTGYDTAANALLQNILCHERGESMVGVVDRVLGY